MALFMGIKTNQPQIKGRRVYNAMDSGLFRAGSYHYGSVVCGHSPVPIIATNTQLPEKTGMTSLTFAPGQTAYSAMKDSENTP